MFLYVNGLQQVETLLEFKAKDGVEMEQYGCGSHFQLSLCSCCHAHELNDKL